MASEIMKAIEVYSGSDGALTTRFYQELGKHGASGLLAINLFRAHKCSARAKVYRGSPGRGQRSYRAMAYERKDWSIRQLVDVLMRHGEALGITWGWKHDPAQEFHCWILYLDLPAGQASYHVASRGHGPAYAGEWDGKHLSCERILAFCDSIMETVTI